MTEETSKMLKVVQGRTDYTHIHISVHVFIYVCTCIHTCVCVYIKLGMLN